MNRLNLLRWVPPWKRCISSLNHLGELFRYKRIALPEYVYAPTIEGRFDSFTIPDGDQPNSLCLPCETERSLWIMLGPDFNVHSFVLEIVDSSNNIYLRNVSQCNTTKKRTLRNT